jgi:uncharacterized paraquat-inducible protein A
MKFLECTSCETEFRIISDSHEQPCWCPFCGTELDNEEETDEEDE